MRERPREREQIAQSSSREQKLYGKRSGTATITIAAAPPGMGISTNASKAFEVSW